MITPKTIGGNLKRKYVGSIKEKEAAFRAEYKREPTTDSEIDAVYGIGAATKALDEVYRKTKKKK